MASIASVKKFLRGIGKKRTLITFHSLGDLDCVGSAIALKRFLKNAQIVAPDKLSSEGKLFLRYIGEEVKLFSEVNKDDYEVFIVLETSSAALIPQAKDIWVDCIIDHHSIHEDAISAKLALVDEKASATCEIVYRLIGDRIDKKSALCLLVGIIADSYRFRSATKETFEITGELLHKVKMEYSDVLALTERKLILPEKIALLKAFERAKHTIVGDVVIVTSQVGSYEAHAATALVSLGADFAFVAAMGKNDARISARMNERYAGKVNLADIMAEVARIVKGTGGGHPVAAGATGTDETRIGEALEKCVELVKERFKKTA